MAKTETDDLVGINRTDECWRRAQLIEAEKRALSLLDTIEREGFIGPGRTEREVEQVYRVARECFAIDKHWHKRIVRSGPNTLAIAGENPPIRTITTDDIVFLDLGPVFEEWEADVGRSYAIGDDPLKHALCRDLPIQFERVRQHFIENQDITGAELYGFAVSSACDAGWRFGGKIAGHIIAEFPHARIPGPKQKGHISPENPDRMRELDANGNARHWILEIHLLATDGSFGGFYERLMVE